MRRSHRRIQLLALPIALAAVVAVAAPAKAAPGDWWQFGYTAANTRFNPNETTIGPSNVGGLVLGAYFGDPAVAGGRVFVSAGGRLRARSAATGALLWSRPGASGGTAPAVTGGVVYSTGVENGVWRLFARSVDSGALRWQRALSGSAGLAVAGGRVLAATSAELRAFDAVTGTPRWRVAVAASGFPAVANGLVYLGLQQGIGAWRLSDGARRWWSDTTLRYGSPVVSGGRVYVSGSTSAGGQPIEVVDQFRL